MYAADFETVGHSEENLQCLWRPDYIVDTVDRMASAS